MASERLIWKDEFGATHSTDKKIKGKYVGDKAIKEKLYEYEQEESEGRLIHLPCKVGDTVYLVDNQEIINYQFDDIVMFLESKKDGICFALLGDFNKVVFLTKQEAEQALKESENNG